MMNFLRSDRAQSTMRLMVIIITIVVCLNILVLPVLIMIALKVGNDLSWISGYLAGLAGLSSAGIVGKVFQKKYETEETNKPVE